MSYHPENFTNYGGFMPYGWKGIMTAMSSGGVLFSLVGFTQVIIMMNEIENPGKYVPIVLIGSLIFTSILYTGLQWSFIASLRKEDLLHGWSNLSFAGDAGPFAALAAIAGMMWLSILLYSDAFISPYSTGLVYSTTAGAMLSGIGKLRDVPQAFTKTNKYNAPFVSLGVNFLFAASMFFLLHNWSAMASFLVVTLMISYAMGPLCLICLRKQLPEYTRPFRLRCAGIIAFVGFYICTAGVYWSGLISILKLLMLIIICLAMYLFYHCVIKKNHHELNAKHSLWLVCYIAGLSIFSYLGNYGGTHIIPLYWDLLYLMAFSLIIFYFALASRMPSTYTQIQCAKNNN
jgi:amino acid transporter